MYSDFIYHTYDAGGNYQVNVTATDDYGQIGSDIFDLTVLTTTLNLTINAFEELSDNFLPLAPAGMAHIGNDLFFNVSIVNNQNLFDYANFTIVWKFGDGIQVIYPVNQFSGIQGLYNDSVIIFTW